MENLPMILTSKEEIIFKNGNYKISTRNRRKKRKKRTKRLLLLILFLAVSVAIWANYEKIKHYAQALIFSLESAPDDSTITSTLGTEQNPDEKPTGEAATQPSPYKIKHPSKSDFVNESSHSIDFDSFNYEFPNAERLKEKFGESAPIVLITCSSPTEAYFSSERQQYHGSANNVSNLATHISNTLISNDIPSLVLTLPESDAPLYEQKSAYIKAISETLDANPSIAYVFDISRNVLIDSNQSHYIELTKSSSLPTVGFVYGTEANELTEERKASVAFGRTLAHVLNESEIFVSRECVSKYSLYQSISAFCLRVDIGSVGNTYDDAIKSATFFAEKLAAFIK